MPPTATALDRAERLAEIRREAEAERLAAERASLDERELASFFAAEAEQIDADERRRQAETERTIRDGHRERETLASFFATTERELRAGGMKAALAPAAVAERQEAAHKRLANIDDRLWAATDDGERKRRHDPSFRAGWDAAHPGGGDGCSCRGHRLWRREIEAGAPVEREGKLDLGREVRILEAKQRLAEATEVLVRRGIPVPTL